MQRKYCEECGIKITRKRSRKYCSKECKNVVKRIEDWCNAKTLFDAWKHLTENQDWSRHIHIIQAAEILLSRIGIVRYHA